MSFNDNEDTVFPTRFGKAIGTSNERKMLESVGGAFDIRARRRKNFDGSVTVLKTHDGMPRFVTEENQVEATKEKTYWYMTSGAYELGQTDPVNVSAVDSVITRKSGQVLTNETNAFKNQEKRLIGRTLLNDNEVSVLYNTTRKTKTQLNREKMTMYQNRPSMFSGLLRRMVQGQYGCGYADCMSGPRPIYTDGADDKRINFQNTWAKSHGVLKFDASPEPLYLLVQLETNNGVLGVKAYPLTVPKGLKKQDVESLWAGLGVNSTVEQAIETLALANAQTDTTKELNLGQVAIPQGESIAYGFSFSMTTHKASIVLRAPAEGLGDIHRWSLITVTFTYSGSVLDYSVNVAEDLIGQMLGPISTIWVGTSTNTSAINAMNGVAWPLTPQDFPVYCYYLGDDLKVVRWQANMQNKVFDPAEWNDSMQAAIWGNSFFGVGSTSCQLERRFGMVGPHGFTLDGSTLLEQFDERKYIKYTMTVSLAADYTQPSTQAFGPISTSLYISLMQTYTNHNAYAYPTGLPYTSAPDPTPGSHYGWYSYQTATATRVSERVEGGGTGSTHRSVLVIPYGDCAACYIGTAKYQSDPKITETYTLSTPQNVAVKEWNMIPIDGANNFAADGVRGESLRQSTPYDLPFASGGMQLTDSSSNTEPDNQFAVAYYGVDTLAAGGIDSTLFHANSSTVVLNHRVIGLTSSLFKNYVYATGTLSEAEAVATGGYPATIDEFVGAS